MQTSKAGKPCDRVNFDCALDYVIAFLKACGHKGPLVVMGRSLGSAPAIELASTRGGDIAGLIVESGFAQTPPLLALFGISLESLGLRDLLGMDNEDKMANVRMPLLVLHAEEDVLLPPWNGERIHERAASDEKSLVTCSFSAFAYTRAVMIPFR